MIKYILITLFLIFSPALSNACRITYNSNTLKRITCDCDKKYLNAGYYKFYTQRVPLNQCGSIQNYGRYKTVIIKKWINFNDHRGSHINKKGKCYDR